MMDTFPLPLASLENAFLRVDYLTSVGPRIIGLYSKQAGVQLLAPSPEVHWPTPHGEYYLYGGHRIWKAPEDSFYNCPEDNVTVFAEEDRVTLRNAVDASGLQKEISFCLEENRVRLTHQITWHGQEPIELAPWTITQLQLGGAAILPQSALTAGSMPTRNFALWPYASLADPRLELHDDLILVHGSADQRYFKAGSYNPFGWAAYVMDKVLFVKRFPATDFRALPDMGCNVEAFVWDSYLELETLGKLTLLNPGESVSFEETWEVIPGDYPILYETARAIVRQFLLTHLTQNVPQV
jgi:hypothetical protein